ncbi:hypothetical protein DFH06DRAFT_308196 [Mycena polygramma]|nr:hypothetical protein DFH06DRAFT_308196 [Mycena polygramma]
MIKTACAWTAGVRHLLRTHIAKDLVIANARANVTIVDFPRRPINRCAVEDLMRRWATKCSWSEALHAGIETEMRAVADQPQIRKGSVHCEAGLVASLLLYTKTQDLDQRARCHCHRDGQKVLSNLPNAQRDPTNSASAKQTPSRVYRFPQPISSVGAPTLAAYLHLGGTGECSPAGSFADG